MIKYWKSTLTILLVCLISNSGPAQKSEALLNHYNHEFKNFKEFVSKNATFKGDTNINVKFYYIDIEIGISSPFVGGSVLCRFEPLIAGLNSIKLNLNGSLLVDSISQPCESFSHENSDIFINLENPVNPGDLVDLTIWYHGVPVLAGGYKGLRYEFHDENEPIIATLSTPYLAHYWYPCKDGPEDKADSVYMDITIPDTIVNNHELIAVSNGVLENIVIFNGKKTYQWRHRYPVVTYYVMAAISNYVHFQDYFNGTAGESFPLDYYVFADDLTASQEGVADLPEVMQLFSDKFGTYPFSNEKYGMTQLGFYGAIENQTNTITNNMMPSWFEVSVHELSHMWFGDMITCSNWHHAWLNEGFATYAEALWAEHLGGFEGYQSNIATDQYWQGGTLYLQNAQDTFNIFQQIVYAKGAFVLHMLRGFVGDTDFFNILSAYTANPDFMYQNATTEDFKNVAEIISGLDLSTFFEQWIYDEYYPVYHYNYLQGNNNEFYFVISQVQESLGFRPVFEMPVNLRFIYDGGGDTTVTVWNNLQFQEYVFQLTNEVDSVEFDPDLWILRQSEFNPDLPVGILELSERYGIKIYPDPVKEKLFISSDFENPMEMEILIYDAQRKIVHRKFIKPGCHTIINVGNDPAGIYFYHLLKSGNSLSSGKYIHSK
jgi:aminopeptidase N